MRTIPLSETTRFIVDNRGKTAPTSEYGIPLIATNCINNRNLYPIYDNIRYVSRDTYTSWFRSHPEPGDIILTLKGSQNGAVCLVPDPVGFVIAQDMVALRVNDDVVDPSFLFAALRSPFVQEQIKNLDVSGVIPHLKKSDFDKLEIPFPPMVEQRLIGRNYLDSCLKIDLLHRQNKTLESIAEALFRHWFIDGAQDDWEPTTIGEIVTIKGGTTPSTKKSEFWDGNICWTSPRDLSNQSSLYLFDTTRKITVAGLAQIGSGLMPVGTVLMSSRAPIGYLTIADIPVAINQGYIAMVCDKSVSNHFVYLWCKANMESIKNAGNGSTFEEISKGNFKALDCLLPPSSLLSDFEIQSEALFRKIHDNSKQVLDLEKIRDTLLPKLMSGDVRVGYEDAA